jgi:hypothetical protein
VDLSPAKKLTGGERFDFEECESEMTNHADSFSAYMTALYRIYYHQLWRADYASFKIYCEQRWGQTYRRVKQLLQAYEIKISMPPEFAELIVNERQARELANIEPERRSAVLDNARSNGNVTAHGIAQASERLTARRQERMQVYDEIGTPITNDALPFWNRKQEVQDMIYSCSKIKTHIEKALSIDDPLYGRVSNGIIMELTAIRHHLLEAMPYTLCTMCQGVPSMQPKGCSFCTNKGLISEHQWKTQVLDEVKKLRLKQNAEYAAEREHATR